MEKIGKLYLELGRFQEACSALKECYLIRKKITSGSLVSNHVLRTQKDFQLCRISALLLYLHTQINTDLAGGKGFLGQTESTANGIRVADLGHYMSDVNVASEKPQVMPGHRKDGILASDLFKNLLGYQRYEQIVAETGINESWIEMTDE